MSEVTNMAMATSSMREGKTTSEFKGKTAVQAMLIFVLVLQRFGVDVQLDEQTALFMITGLEAAYTFGRSIVKGFQARSTMQAHTTNIKVNPSGISPDESDQKGTS